LIKLLRKIGLVHDGDETVPSPAAEAPAVPVDGPEKTTAASGSSDGEPNSGSSKSIAPRIVRLPKARFDEGLSAEETVPLEYPFEVIYEKAGVEDPPHGFTVYKLMEMISAEEMAGLDPQARARMITAMLSHLPNGGVDLADIIHDAAQRDRALDAFEDFLGRRVADAMVEVESENEALKAEIDRVTESHGTKIAANEARLNEERGRLEAWRSSKRREEKRLHDAIEAFVESSPISLDGEE
jgi:hypothetical protein